MASTGSTDRFAELHPLLGALSVFAAAPGTPRQDLATAAPAPPAGTPPAVPDAALSELPATAWPFVIFRAG
ncbi:hypothetical protein [Streptomyces spectabilis]|uniref:Uncharacterized protein n=1 Tax=Streptomyces spectabilis TaxID=68270 RepID=A0A5P2XB88_STRST|nr:hypothetical protein [Streptomyces spectabilis]MBB5106823.1 hypothetical protein [Streptomyces spectabilis]MCI3903326.1 hypothetical protein [Streptomyces spectabilis]QEV60549.1 hypothetical protein CP982_18975 [Streptomyces spectabilis]GGV44061.1 hypothetical protein GCM10010245_69120 [Streptomyces spectabilis]